MIDWIMTTSSRASGLGQLAGANFGTDNQFEHPYARWNGSAISNATARFPSTWESATSKSTEDGNHPGRPPVLTDPLHWLLLLPFLCLSLCSSASTIKPLILQHFRAKSTHIQSSRGPNPRVHFMYSRDSALKFPQELDVAVVTFTCREWHPRVNTQKE